MQATKLKSLLSDLSDLLRTAGAGPSAKDVSLLAERIDTSGDKAAAEALQDLEAELTVAEPSRFTPQRYIRALSDAGLDAKAFDAVFRALQSDKSIKKADAIIVLKGYAGTHARARSKAEAVEEIQRQFTKLLYDANANRQAASTPW